MLMAWLRLDISIHALRKESDKIKRLDRTAQKISIHALRKESDNGGGYVMTFPFISIHALRKESDTDGHVSQYVSRHFNPRSP